MYIYHLVAFYLAWKDAKRSWFDGKYQIHFGHVGFKTPIIHPNGDKG